MFEARILCRRVSKSVYDLDNEIMLLDHSLMSAANNKTTEKNVERQIRDYKRQCLAKTLEKYELQIEENECLFQEELLRLVQSDELLRQQQHHHNENFINCLNNYLKHYIDAGLRKIRYNETVFRMKLNHPRHRYVQSTSVALPAMIRVINVYPEAIIEIPETDNHHLFTDKELALLSSAGIRLIFPFGS